MVAFVLLLTACGAEAASPSDGSTAPEAKTASTEIRAPAATLPALLPEIQAAFPSRLALTAKDGHILTFSPGEEPIDTSGLMGPTYRVRVIDTATGQLGLPLNLRDKSQTVDEVMTAVSRTAVFEPNNQLLFTLYQDATEGGENVGSFIHTLGLVNGVWCLDVPSKLGLADNPGALAVSPDGSRLFAASSIGGVAGYEVTDITTFGPDMPEARATTAVAATAEHVAIGASRDQVILALGGSLFRLDPATLEVRDSFAWDMDVEALTVLDDGSAVIVGTGRMTLLSPDNKLLAERALPMNAGEITRVAVVH